MKCGTPGSRAFIEVKHDRTGWKGEIHSRCKPKHPNGCSSQFEGGGTRFLWLRGEHVYICVGKPGVNEGEQEKNPASLSGDR